MTGDPLRTAPWQRVGLAVAILLLGVTGLVVALSSLQDVTDRDAVVRRTWLDRDVIADRLVNALDQTLVDRDTDEG